jgi:hypothetical protein
MRQRDRKGEAAAPGRIDGVGTLELFGDAISTSLPDICAGLVKPIARTGAKRSAVLPDLPTIASSGIPGYDMTSRLAMFAPASTPKELDDTGASSKPITMPGGSRAACDV